MRLPSARVAPMSRVSSVLASLSLANTCLNSRITHTAPKTAFKFSLELFKNGFGKRDLSPSDLGSSIEFQDQGNKISRLLALSVFLGLAGRLGLCISSPATSIVCLLSASEAWLSSPVFLPDH